MGWISAAIVAWCGVDLLAAWDGVYVTMCSACAPLRFHLKLQVSPLRLRFAKTPVEMTEPL
jgi:hypothetical protein